MTTKSKTFDCVEMKNRIQAAIQVEYEAHRGEFPSFVEFVKAAAAQSEYARAMPRNLAALELLGRTPSTLVRARVPLNTSSCGSSSPRRRRRLGCPVLRSQINES